MVIETDSSRAAGLLEAYRGSAELEAARAALAGCSTEIGGFWGASLAFFLAAWKDPGRPEALGPCLIVTSSQEEADELAEELEVFSTLPVLAFPAWESLFLEDAIPDGEIYRQRLLVADCLHRRPEEALFVVAPVQAALQPVPSARSLAQARRTLRAGKELNPLSLAETLIGCGFRRVPVIQARGEFSPRGDIFDLFPYHLENPLRLEFFGETLESIRHFHAESQRSLAASETGEAEILLVKLADVYRDCFRGGEPLITDLLGDRGKLFVKDPQAVFERARRILDNRLGDQEAAVAQDAFLERLAAVSSARVHSLPIAGSQSGLNLRYSSVERFRSPELKKVCDGLAARLKAGYAIEVYCENAAEAQRFVEILRDHGMAEAERLSARAGTVRRGFEVTALKGVVLTTRELFDRHVIRRVRRRTAPSRPIESFLELEKGDCIVHSSHGIGRYLGIEAFEKNGVLQEFLTLEFRDQVKVYVPVSKIDLVQKYLGAGDRQPVLDKVGGTSWTRKKQDVEAALFDLASDLLEIHALRKDRPGFACPADTDWQREFEAAFPFEETPDQISVLASIKEDMESPRPMDRLVCGDVGYGKTELAMRATFKMVLAGRQVAVLVPTTVLAQQHFRTFSERMAGFPVRIEMLSRFRTPAEQKETIRAAAGGGVDVLIGTHRLLSDDVGFRDLGLVIIDEEQRFGVTNKEKLKRMRSTVDVLTLTATPIPRTLHMALLGIRDISSLSTPPEGRSPVKTEICRFEPRRVREVFIRELERDGQVYFVHNRIEDIDDVKFTLEKLVPEARMEFAHGQMNEHELEAKMLRFFEGGIDVLISTTIIESGLDVPNVNTIFIDEADRYGLADLHQLRGRVGRYKHQAYCYLLLPEQRRVNPDAEKRIRALVEFSELGAGFQIAIRDLEIRGAGNILGPEQSGHIAAVGYDMYCRLLEKAVRKLRNESETGAEQVEIDLELEAFIPDGYLAGESAKLEMYRRISAAKSEQDIVELGGELEDRFGPPPAEVGRLLDVQRLRVLAAALGVEYVGERGDHLILAGGERMQRLLESCPGRVAVLDLRTVAVPLELRRRGYAPRSNDERVFRHCLEWFQSGVFPEPARGQGSHPRPAGRIPTT